ncbi:MAG TPA: hypothetical protein PK033_04570 [Acetivibrio sp.]|jgi:hypothetical protein|nr:hypothetical protein [Clostridium sp.]HOQ36441.1 hypothetical protein [Acetivibrio sp.]HQA57132.1 hypothetical protein [Acetivibrio sp.]
MEHVRYYRKYPRTHAKQQEADDNEFTISMGAAVAAGILALTFVNGMFWGYMLKRKLG